MHRSVTPLLMLLLAGPPVFAQDAQAPADDPIERMIDRLEQRIDVLLQQADDEQAQKQIEALEQRIADLERVADARGGRLFQALPQAKAELLQDPLAGLTREEVVTLLDDEAYATRELAEYHLLADNTIDQDVLLQIIALAESDEQRCRLIRVAEHHVMRVTREAKFAGQDAADPFRGNPAAIGFSYAPVAADNNPHTQAPAVSVIATMPGFPGHAHLQLGDTVLAVNGQTGRPARFENDARWIGDLIKQYKPGDTITLTIARQGQLIDVAIIAAGSIALNDMYTTNGRDAAVRSQPYETAWENARQSLTAEWPQPERLIPADSD